MSIVLFGMPLSGKTTMAKIISKKLSVKHIDLDDQIENAYGDSTSNLFFDLGEKAFRSMEHNILEKIRSEKKCVLSLGGGAVNSLNIDIISSYSIRVWLQCPLPVIAARYKKSEKDRPLLYNTNNLMRKLEKLYKARKSFFNNLSNIIVDTSIYGINRTSKEVMKKINEHN